MMYIYSGNWPLFSVNTGLNETKEFGIHTQDMVVFSSAQKSSEVWYFEKSFGQTDF